MSYATEKAVSGRRPLTVVELDLDTCTLRYGVAPCTAALNVTGAAPCFNTRATCQDPDNYHPFTTGSPTERAYRTYRFCTPRSDLPVNLSAIPSVRAVQLAPTKIDVQGGLGQRASVTVTLQDHSHHDRGQDDYVATRFAPTALQLSAGVALQLEPGIALQAKPRSLSVLPSGANLPGTFWGRLRARNPYYLGRVLRVRTGYLTDAGYDEDNFITRTYLVESITGPDARGTVTIKAKDPLKLADDDRALVPAASTGRLDAGIAAATTSATLAPSGIGDSEYPAEGWIRIGSEVMAFSRSGDALTLTRAQFGTQSAAHDAGDVCQLCKRFEPSFVDEILYDLLSSANVPDTYLPLAEWQAEVYDYLPRQYSTLISEPTAVNKLIKELTQAAAFSVWWDERSAQVKLRALRAPSSTSVLDEDSHLLADSVQVTDKPDLRVSQGWVYFAQIDVTEPLTEPRNYRALSVNADLDADGADKFGQPSIKQVLTRWIPARNTADELAEQLVTQFGETPRQITFSLDAKDSQWWTGDVVFLRTRLVQDFQGRPLPLAVQIIQATEDDAAHRFTYVAQAFNFTAPPVVGDQIFLTGNDVDLLAAYIAAMGTAPTPETSVTFIVVAGVTIGQQDAAASLRTNVWPAGAQIALENNGTVQGRGGDGATSGENEAFSGQDGGTALLAEYPITVFNNGALYGGGGGGGGSWPLIAQQLPDSSAGGGGAGTVPGQGGVAFVPPFFAEDGTASTGGAGAGTFGGAGGGPGLDGEDAGGNLSAGLAGFYVQGNDLVTWGATGTRVGRVA